MLNREEYNATFNCNLDEDAFKAIMGNPVDIFNDDIDKIRFVDKEGHKREFAPVKHGKWVNNIHDMPICNQCGYMTPYDRAIDDYEYGNFCPNCGADMRDAT